VSFEKGESGAARVWDGSYVNERTMAERLVKGGRCKLLHWVHRVRTRLWGWATAVGPGCHYRVEAWETYGPCACESSRSGGAVAAREYLGGSLKGQLVKEGD